MQAEQIIRNMSSKSIPVKRYGHNLWVAKYGNK